MIILNKNILLLNKFMIPMVFKTCYDQFIQG